MLTTYGHLTYCSNIHAGESWQDHFAKLQEHIPIIKKQLSPQKSFGIGLRLSNEASIELLEGDHLAAFQQWLQDQDCYVFTMNGFPYGGFHHTKVKDNVHAPDWTTSDRVEYTKRLVRILAELLPAEMDGGISTSPLSYRFWHNGEDLPQVFDTATYNILDIVDFLLEIKAKTGKLIHLDIEPEPDGLLGEGKEFIDWYTQYLLPLGVKHLQEQSQISADAASAAIKEHIQLCYDVCHFAICYEDHAEMIRQIKALGIKTGKIQISAALKAKLPVETIKRTEVIDAFERFNEPVYLHQVVAKQRDSELIRYADMPEALADKDNLEVTEWRAHFHVPLFIEQYDVLQSTQQDIRKVLALHKNQSFTSHLEVETYTWEVLPQEMRMPLMQSIIREMEWVNKLLCCSSI